MQCPILPACLPIVTVTDELHQFIEVLTVAIEARDAHTSLHSYRVAEMTGVVALVMGWTEAEAELLHIAGHLHDIGKLGIPDAILRKPGSLEPDEREVIQQHSVIGWQILSHIDSFADVALWVRHHHERFDGSGYPDRLSGTRIPLGARVIAVADAFDAMLSERPYRSNMGLLDAIEELIAHRGTQFDPEVIDAFREVAREFYGTLFDPPSSSLQVVRLRV